MTNARFDILAENDAYRDLFRDWALAALHPPEHAVVHPHRASRARQVPAVRGERPVPGRPLPRRLREACWRPGLEEDIRRLTLLSGEFAELWARHEVAEFRPGIRTFIHPHAGALTFTTNELQVPAAHEARIGIYTPADDETRKRLPLTLRLTSRRGRRSQPLTFGMNSFSSRHDTLWAC